VKSSMQTLQELALESYPELKDCYGTLAFIERFNELIDIMNSKSGKTAMHAKNPVKKASTAFLHIFNFSYQ
jgi:hypothetical protein